MCGLTRTYSNGPSALGDLCGAVHDWAKTRGGFAVVARRGAAHHIEVRQMIPPLHDWPRSEGGFEFTTIADFGMLDAGDLGL